MPSKAVRLLFSLANLIIKYYVCSTQFFLMNIKVNNQFIHMQLFCRNNTSLLDMKHTQQNHIPHIS